MLFRAGGYTGVQFFEILGSLFSFVVFGYLLLRLTFFVLRVLFWMGFSFVILASVGSRNGFTVWACYS